MNTPITYDVAKSVWGDDPKLSDDSTRTAFFAVWAFAIVEMEEAIKRERAIRRRMAFRKFVNFFAFPPIR